MRNNGFSVYAQTYQCAEKDCDSILCESNQKNQRKIYCNDCVYRRKNQRAKERRSLIQKARSK